MKVFPERVFSMKIVQSDHWHLTLHIRNNLRTKIYRNLPFCFCGSHLLKKGYSALKQKTSHFYVRPSSILTKLNFLARGGDRHSGIFIALLLLVQRQKMNFCKEKFNCKATRHVQSKIQAYYLNKRFNTLYYLIV